MTTEHGEAIRYRAILQRDKKYDGVFYFAKTTGVYCRPSCPALHPQQPQYIFFDTTDDARAHGYHPCKRCWPDRVQKDLSLEIFKGIDAGVIEDKGIRGLASSLHISERHLRRVVQGETGISPARLNQEKRLSAAKRLVVQTKLPFIDVAFHAGFSSLRQFNDMFKRAFEVSPRQMRKTARYTKRERSPDVIATLVRSSHRESFT